MQRLRHWRIDIHHGVVTALLDVEGEVSAGDDVDDLLDADISHAVRLLLADVSPHHAVGGGGPLGPLLAVVGGLGRGGRGAVLLALLGSRGSRGGGGVAGAPGTGALLGTGVPTDLDGALEVDLHAVGELEGLEVGVAQDGGAGAEVLDLVELGHELGPGHTAGLVHQLDGSALAIVSHAVSDQHVELLLVVLDSQDHRHGLSDLDQAGHLAGPGTLADLDLHPAAHVVSGKVGSDNIQHVHGERSECYRFLVLVMPSASQFPGLIPDFLDLRVVLDHDGVLKVGS